jgi:hypothetical protein
MVERVKSVRMLAQTKGLHFCVFTCVPSNSGPIDRGFFLLCFYEGKHSFSMYEMKSTSTFHLERLKFSCPWQWRVVGFSLSPSWTTFLWRKSSPTKITWRGNWKKCKRNYFLYSKFPKNNTIQSKWIGINI